MLLDLLVEGDQSLVDQFGARLAVFDESVEVAEFEDRAGVNTQVLASRVQSALMETPTFMMSGDSMMCRRDGATRWFRSVAGLKSAIWNSAIRFSLAIWISERLF